MLPSFFFTTSTSGPPAARRYCYTLPPFLALQHTFAADGTAGDDVACGLARVDSALPLVFGGNLRCKTGLGLLRPCTINGVCVCGGGGGG